MQAYLILANGRILKGKSLGCQGTTVGEVVFATGMVGFEETLTDPSYYGQIITQTYPLIGNYGMNSEDKESGKIWAKGYIVREACTTPSNFRSEETLDTFLKENGIIGIEGIDTRSLTRILRESGVMNGAITTEFDPETEPEKLAALMPIIKAYAVTGAVDAVTCTEPQCFAPTAGVAEGEEPLHIALLDLGCKKNIVRCLCKRGCRVTVLPASTTLAELKALAPDGLMLSNGPGDPAENVQVIANIRDMLDTGIPAFGICLGHQAICEALGGRIIYASRLMHGKQSQVALDESCPLFQGLPGEIPAARYHSLAVAEDSLPDCLKAVARTQDGEVMAVAHRDCPVYGLQFHPESILTPDGGTILKNFLEGN